MHPEARTWIAEHAKGIGSIGAVVDIGGRSVNGTVRDLFDCQQYTSVDLFAGAGVDVIADATMWRPDGPVDVVVCCEVLEHTPDGEALIRSAGEMLALGGWLLVTCATDPRAPHSTLDGGDVRRGEWYANVSGRELAGWAGAAGLVIERLERYPDRGDLYMAARKLL